MRGRDVVLLVLLGVVLTLGVGGYLWWEFRDSDKEPTVARSSSSESTTKPQQQSNQPANTQSSLQVQGVNNVTLPQNQPQTPALPLPTEFGQYEEHANAAGPLYTDEVVGSGQEAKSGDQVAMFYKGWLTDGQLFDQTRPDETGEQQPFVFQLGSGQVIAGWDQGIAGMKVGGKRRLVIPSTFGYGEAGQGPIPPNAMLIFDVELLAVQTPAP